MKYYQNKNLLAGNLNKILWQEQRKLKGGKVSKIMIKSIYVKRIRHN